MGNAIRELFIMYIVLSIGFGFNKKVKVSRETENTISKLIINITLPALTFYSIINDFNSEMLNQYLTLFVAGFFIAILGLLISYLSGRFIFNIKDIPVFSFLSTFGNNVYLGAPICYALFGSQGFIMAIVFDLGMAVIIWSIGVWMINEKIEVKKFSHNLKGLISPPLLSIIAGILVSYNNLILPGVLMESAELIGGITIPLAMLFIGFKLSKFRIQEVLQNKFNYYISLVKLIIIPGIVLLLLGQSNIEQIILGVIIVESGMPVFVNSSIMLNEYADKGKIASGSVFVST
ncbi:MAG: AEC family transporter, partial [Halarsenatibacteraceae bacterium]